MPQAEYKYTLYKEYCLSLGQYDKRLLSADSNSIAHEYYLDPQTEWIDIYDEDQPVGFLIICFHGGDCHPEADYCIAQAFILEEHRRKGLMFNTVSEFLQSHKGIYTLDIIKGNEQAEWFWDKVLEANGAEYIDLPEVRRKSVCGNLNMRSFYIR